MAFHVGQKVVCVDARGPAGYAGIQKDRVYVVDSISREFLSVPETRGMLWFQARFRPLIERKTDISIFTEMLKPKQRELVGND